MEGSGASRSRSLGSLDGVELQGSADDGSKAVGTGANSGGKGKADLGERACKAKLLKLLGMRDYAVESMRSKLLGAGFQPDVVQKTIEYALRTKFLDDTRYAENHIASKKDMGWGRGRIEKSLAEKGIDCSLLPGYPEALFPEADEVDRAVRCVRSHRTSAKNVRDAHYRYLISKGYSASVASRALREFC